MHRLLSSSIVVPAGGTSNPAPGPSTAEENQNTDSEDDAQADPSGRTESESDEPRVRDTLVNKAPRGQMQISLALDSTMDPEKLEKYLKLLQKYGAIG